MAISNKEMYHGAVLYQVVSNPDFSLKLIGKDKDEHDSGMYEVTTNTKDYVLYIKYRSQTRPGDLCCDFSFLPTHINNLRRYPDKEFLVCLVLCRRSNDGCHCERSEAISAVS